MKKTARRKHYPKARKRQGSSVGTYVVIFLFVILLILLAKVAVRAFRKPFVLGISSSGLLAKGNDSGGGKGGGDDHGGSSGGGGSSSGGGGSSSGGGGSNSGGGSSSGSKTEDSNKGTSQQGVSNETVVDCVGPDGKHFQTSFKDCADLNKAFNKPNFNFTPLTTQVQQVVNQEVEDNSKKLQVQIQARQQIQQENKNGAFNNLQVQTQNGKAQVNINQQGTVVEIKNENGKTEIRAKKADGTEVKLSSDDAVKKLNEVLKEKEIEVEETPDKELVIKKGEVEAETKVPVSIDPVTKTLSITTPAGLKIVTVLPDQAVANLIANKEITNVTQQSTNFGANSSKRIVLTELNNEPVFQVDGVLNKKLLGVVPLSFAKTSFVSGTTGNVVRTNEALINRILEAFSF